MLPPIIDPFYLPSYSREVSKDWTFNPLAEEFVPSYQNSRAARIRREQEEKEQAEAVAEPQVLDPTASGEQLSAEDEKNDAKSDDTVEPEIYTQPRFFGKGASLRIPALPEPSGFGFNCKPLSIDEKEELELELATKLSLAVEEKKDKLPAQLPAQRKKLSCLPDFVASSFTHEIYQLRLTAKVKEVVVPMELEAKKVKSKIDRIGAAREKCLDRLRIGPPSAGPRAKSRLPDRPLYEPPKMGTALKIASCVISESVEGRVALMNKKAKDLDRQKDHEKMRLNRLRNQ